MWNDDSMVNVIVGRLKEGLPEEEIAERLMAGMPNAEFAFRVAAMLGRAADNPDGIRDGDGEYGIQVGVVADLMLPLAEERLEAERPVCPSNDFGCPYWTESGRCTLKDPARQCDDYMYYAGNGGE